MINNKKKPLTWEQRFKRLIHFGHDKAPETEIVQSISEGVEFHGARLWILVLAVFVASLGLNTNSAAVIIGAMLISPLMGPIIGMGFGVGIYDFELFKRSARNYIITTTFSVATACLYFLISPLDEAQSELLARTSPTIYDVCIALCGGLAGIIALSSRSQRAGNVIPGVAIATALMPPLCTVGYGIALGNWVFAAGAFYLYLINTVFIALSTFLGAAFILKLNKKKQVDKSKEKQVRRIISAIALLTIIPSIYLTFDIIKKTVYEQNIREFVQTEFTFKHSQVLNYTSDYQSKRLRIMMVGEPIDTTGINFLTDRMHNYHIQDTKLEIVQSGSRINEKEILSLVNNMYDKKISNQNQSEKRIHELEMILSSYKMEDGKALSLYPELNALCPEVNTITWLRGKTAFKNEGEVADSSSHMILVTTDSALPSETITTLTNWLKQRTGIPYLGVLFQQIKEEETINPN